MFLQDSIGVEELYLNSQVQEDLKNGQDLNINNDISDIQDLITTAKDESDLLFAKEIIEMLKDRGQKKFLEELLEKKMGEMVKTQG